MNFDGECASALEKISKLHPKLIDLSLDRIEALLELFQSPQNQLSNVFHIAGTNGKGSVTAYLTAMTQAWGKTANVMTSPHLVSYTERFRIRNKLITLLDLDELLDEILERNEDHPLTIFEALTTAGFLAFARNQADVTILETGLGGRFDATNVVSKPKACLITSISLDHQGFLGDSITKIAPEKAGIIKEGVPVFSSCRNPEAIEILRKNAKEKNAPFFQIGEHFSASKQGDKFLLQENGQTLELSMPSLPGQHQLDNAALAVMAFKHCLDAPIKALNGIKDAHWPGRIQQLDGKLAKMLPQDSELWIDGAHNPDGAFALANWLTEKQKNDPKEIRLLFSCSEGRDPVVIAKPLAHFAPRIKMIAEENQQNAQNAAQVEKLLNAANIKTCSSSTIDAAISAISDNLEQENKKSVRVIIFGSLYLAGIALQKDGYIPS